MHMIQICWEEDLKYIMCYTNSMHTIHLVKEAYVSTHHYENEKTILESTWLRMDIPTLLHS